MRARLVSEDGSVFVAFVEVPDTVEHIRYGECIFQTHEGSTTFRRVPIFSAPIEGSEVGPP